MVSANDVAKYILVRSHPDEGDIISHLKLQKLLYYCQGFQLAINDEPLFEEEIRHWDHGPVVPAVYAYYKNFGAAALEIPEDFDVSVIPDSAKAVIDEVMVVYGQFSAWKLRQMTHDESPWADTDDNEEISPERLKAYFKTQLIDR